VGKKAFFLIVFFIFLVFYAVPAWAAGQIFLKTSPRSIQQSFCETAGSITLEIDSGTSLREGDRIQFTLTNGAAFCRKLDFFLTILPGNSPDFPDHFPGTAFASPVSTSSSADKIAATFPGLAGAPTYTQTEYDYGFRVQAPVASPTVQLILGRRNRITGEFRSDEVPGSFYVTFDASGGDIWDSLVIRLFDQKFETPYFWKPDPEATGTRFTIDSSDTENPFTGEDNSLKVDTSKFSGNFLGVTPDSIPSSWEGIVSPLTLFFSGDFRIARITSTPGDLDCGGTPDLGDAILGLRLLSGQEELAFCFSDINGDDRIGIEEIIYILREMN
jgi:hypothetical protein